MLVQNIDSLWELEGPVRYVSNFRVRQKDTGLAGKGVLLCDAYNIASSYTVLALLKVYLAFFSLLHNLVHMPYFPSYVNCMYQEV